MANFIEAKFKYLARFKKFGWIWYPTTQYPVHENLLRVFFSNATLEDTDEHDEDPCRIVVINTSMMGMPILVIQEVVAKTFAMSDNDFSDEHVGFPLSMLISNDNASNLSFHKRFLHFFISHFFRPIGSKHITVR